MNANTKNNSEPDLFANGIVDWAKKIRGGKLSFRQTTEICLRSVRSNPQLNAFEFIDEQLPLAAASYMDECLGQGIDLGPLMGLPVGIKDIMVVEGMPTGFGTNADMTDLALREGTVVKTLKASGAVILGKTKTVEFALGATGVNESRGTPWNPVDRQTHLMPGGSSSGSAVATSAGQVGFALGTDTGGSIRNPACMTGIVGHKTTTGFWPLDGIFSLSTTLDSVGPLCRTVEDAALLHQVFSGESVTPRKGVEGLRIGIVEDLFFDNLDSAVAADFERVAQVLEANGAHRIRVEFPEVHERTELFSAIVPSELIHSITPERFQNIRDGVDTVTESRAAVGLETSAHAYLAALNRRTSLIHKANKTFNDVDLWLSPTVPVLPLPVNEFVDENVHQRALLASQNTQPGNLLDFCSVSIPMHKTGLPTGLQLMMPGGQDARLLSIAASIASLINAD